MRTLFSRTGWIAVCLLISIPAAQAQSRTPEELVTSVLKALEANNTESLKVLAISQDEVKKFVWPAVSVNMAGAGMNADKFATGYETSNQAGLKSVLSEFGGKKLDLVKVEMPTPQKKAGTTTLFPAPTIRVRDESGQEKTVRIVGGILDQNGLYKVTTYYVSGIR